MYVCDYTTYEFLTIALLFHCKDFEVNQGFVCSNSLIYCQVLFHWMNVSQCLSIHPIKDIWVVAILKSVANTDARTVEQLTISCHFSRVKI